MKSHDLIVVGAGIVGAACAERATAQGLKVALVESATVGGGTTAAAMGHLVALDGTAAELALAHYSLGLWEQALPDVLQAEYSRCGTLWVAETGREAAAIPAKAARLAAAGIATRVLDADTLYREEPALVPGLAGGLLVPDEGVVYPPAVARHLVALARSRGAAFHARRAALSAQGVTLDDGTALSGPVLVATGGALAELLPELPLRLRKGHLVITDRYPGVIHHQLVELGYADSVAGEEASSVAFNAQPRPTGQILIGSSREFGQTGTEVSLPLVGRMLERALRFLPGMAQLQAIRIWTGLRPDSIDGLPYLGRVPGRRDVWVAAGHEGLGITTSLGSARLLVDQITGRQPAIDPAPFDPARALH